MPQFVTINPDIKVNGQTILSVVDGMTAKFALSILAENGIKNPLPDNWYPQQNWLNAFKEISKKIGYGTLLLIGLKIPDNAEFPPEINNIHQALASIDVAYHMNHSLDGKLLYDVKTGEMTEGIGHYHYKKIAKRKAEIRCNNPYPCDFDRGIIQAISRKYKPKKSLFVSVEHDESVSCRKKGDSTCMYQITW